MAIDPIALAASSGLLDGSSRARALGAGFALDATNQTTGSSSTGGTNLTGAFGLSRDDFFKLFLAQLQHQDPTKPLDDQQMLGELAQFSMIDTLSAVEKSLSGQQLAQGSSLIGKQVQGMATDGKTLTGVVDSVYQDSTKGLVLVVGTRAITPDNVSLVTTAPTAPTAPATPSPDSSSTAIA
jgi:flagellar basal-body rod modification protein FlgD